MELKAENKILTLLEDNISRGKWKTGDTLPGYEELCKQFRISPNTVRKVYQELVRRGSVRKIGKFYYVTTPEFNSFQYQAFVIFFSGKQSNFPFILNKSEFGMAFHKLEHYLLSKNCRMIFENYDNMEKLLQELSGSGKLIRGIILAGQKDVFHTFGSYISVKERLQKKLLTWKGTPPRVLAITKNYSDPKVPWYFSCTGHQTTVIFRELSHFIRKKQFKFIRFFLQEERDTPSAFANAFRLIPEIDQFKPGIHCRYTIKRTSSTYQQFLNKIFRDKPRDHIEARLNKYRKIDFKEVEALFDFVEEFPWEQKFPPFNLSDTKGELWILQKDQDGKAAKKSLSKWNISIPGKVSLLSLENNPEYLHHGISACVPDWETTGYQLGRALLSEGIISKTSKGFVATSALVLERLTTPY